MKIKIISSIIITFGISITGQVLGGEISKNNFQSQAIISASCTVAANSINFGSGNNNQTLKTSNTVSLVCSKSVVYTLGMAAGLSIIDNKIPARKLIAKNIYNNDTLNYNLYKDYERTTILGTTAENLISGVGTGATQEIPFYADLFTAYVTPDNYTDTIFVLLNY